MYNFDEIIDRRHMRSSKWNIPEDWVSLGVADMDFRSPLEIQSALLSDLAIGNFGYKDGLHESFFRAAIDWEHRRHHMELKPEWLSFAPGVIAGLAQAIQALTKPGDRIVILTPVYGPFFGLASMDGRVKVECPLRNGEKGWEIDFDALDAACDGAAALLFCSPHNPVGRVWTENELRQVCQICCRRNCWLFVDEIHHDLMLDGRTFLTPAQVSPDFSGRIVQCGAPSKTFNIAGFGASWVCARDPKAHEAIHGLSRLLHIGSGMYSFLAGEAAYDHGDEWLDACLHYIEQNRAFASEFLTRELPDCPFAKLEGTYLMWVDCRGLNVSGTKIVDSLHSHGLNVAQGEFFGAPEYMRLNIATPKKLLETGLERFAAGIRAVR